MVRGRKWWISGWYKQFRLFLMRPRWRGWGNVLDGCRQFRRLGRSWVFCTRRLPRSVGEALVPLLCRELTLVRRVEALAETTTFLLYGALV